MSKEIKLEPAKTAEQIKAEAEAALKAEAKEREDAFLKEFNELKKKHNCEIIPVVTIYPNQAPVGGIKVKAL